MMLKLRELSAQLSSSSSLWWKTIRARSELQSKQVFTSASKEDNAKNPPSRSIRSSSLQDGSDDIEEDAYNNDDFEFVPPDLEKYGDFKSIDWLKDMANDRKRRRKLHCQKQVK